MTKNILAIREVEILRNFNKDLENIFKIINFEERYYFKLIFVLTDGSRINHVQSIKPSENIKKFEPILYKYNLTNLYKVVVIYYRYTGLKNQEEIKTEITKLKYKKNSIDNKIISLESQLEDLKIQAKYSKYNRFEFRNEDF